MSGGERGGESGPMAGPPPEAFESCTGKKAGEECVVKREDWEMKGLCATPPGAAEGRLGCAPKPRGPQGGDPAKAPPPPAHPPKKSL